MSPFEPAADDPFGVRELPYGIFRHAGGSPRVGVAVGHHVLDTAALAAAVGEDPAPFTRPNLNAFLAFGPQAWAEHRSLLQWAVSTGAFEPHLRPLSEVDLCLPFAVGDYVDFYANEHHASNVGRMFRPDGDPLTPNWKHLPIGYHGRAGTVVVSGTDVVRPCGQRRAPTSPGPDFGPSDKLDFEVELGFVVGVGSALGTRVGVADFADHVFGVVLVNDWSARDLQAWEYVPLGPFLGKSFATSISAWVVPLAALREAAVPLPGQAPELLAYLQGPGGTYDIDIDVELNGLRLSTCPYPAMYYSPAQLLAHLTVNGASLRTGDLFASGTISGPSPDQLGSLLELTWNGTRPIESIGRDGFLADGDEVVMRGAAHTPDGDLRLGEVRGRVLPAVPSRSTI